MMKYVCTFYNIIETVPDKTIKKKLVETFEFLPKIKLKIESRHVLYL